MNVSDVIALVAVLVALIALAVSVLSYQQTKRTADANASMATSTAAAAKAAREAIDHERAAALASLRASLQPRFGPGRTIGLTKGPDGGEIVPILRNEGRHNAYDVALSIEHPDGMKVYSRGIETIGAGTEQPIAIPVTQDDFNRARGRSSTIRVSYRDGTGPGETSFRVRLVGQDNPNWQVLLED